MECHENRDAQCSRMLLFSLGSCRPRLRAEGQNIKISFQLNHGDPAGVEGENG